MRAVLKASKFNELHESLGAASPQRSIFFISSVHSFIICTNRRIHTHPDERIRTKMSKTGQRDQDKEHFFQKFRHSSIKFINNKGLHVKKIHPRWFFFEIPHILINFFEVQVSKWKKSGSFCNSLSKLLYLNPK